VINSDQAEVVDHLSRTHTPAALVSALQQLSQADANLARNAHIELTLETLFIKLADLAARHTRHRTAG